MTQYILHDCIKKNKRIMFLKNLYKKLITKINKRNILFSSNIHE
jgi:hypothetical protein